MMDVRAHAWASGLIEFRADTQPCPEGALPLPDVPRGVIEVRARRAYDGRSLLVPGVPEATSPADALEALERFSGFLLTDSSGKEAA